MRALALILAACAASTLNPVSPAYAAGQAKAAAQPEQRLAHISIRSIGSGSPVVLIPGLSTPRDVWSGIAPTLAAKHRVLLVQINGFGDEPGKNADAGLLDGVVEDIHAYLGSNQLGGAAVVGHSLGGLVAMKLALAHPENVERLMVVDALPFFGTVLDDKATVDSVRPMAESMRSRMASAADAIRARAATPVTSDPGGDMSLTPAGRIQIANWSMKSDPLVVGQAVFEDMTTDLRTRIVDIRAPMTVLYHTGGDPTGINAKVYARDYAAQPKVALVPVAEAGHFIMLDQPSKFANAVENFLR